MPETVFPRSKEEADAFDESDPLREARAAFNIPDGFVYLVGHSLGPVTHSALAMLDRGTRDDWSNDIVGAWNSAGWIDLPAKTGERIARLIGAEPDEVIVCDSVSVNLFKLVGALLTMPDFKRRIIVESGEFPTDQYILERLALFSGAEFVRTPHGGGVSALNDGGILVRSLVDYRSAAVADVKAVEAVASRCGGAVVWDLSHATGVLDLDLHALGASYAVGCTYKYLNGGPGAPAFLYVDRKAAGSLETPLAGWLGHARPFAFEDTYEAGDGLQRFVAGTPPILSMLALNGALDVLEDVSLSSLETKARQLGDMCLNWFENLGLPSISPLIGTRRGGHVSVIHPDGYAVSRALAERGIKTDFRTPDTIRFGLSPLYLRYGDVWQAMESLRDILESGEYRHERFSTRSKVT